MLTANTAASSQRDAVSAPARGSTLKTGIGDRYSDDQS